MKRRSLAFDPLLVGLALLLTFIGLFFIFDAGYARALADNRGVIPLEFKSQLGFLAIAIVAVVLCGSIRPTLWLRASRWVWYGSLALLVLVAKFGIEMNGAKRWIGFHQFGVQPAEFAKLAVVVYLAALFAERKPWPKLKPRRDIPHWLDTVAVPKLQRAFPGVLVLFAAYLIDKEPDMGTAAVVAVTAFVLCFLGGISRTSVVACLVMAVFGGFALVKAEPYRLVRIENHLQRWDPQNVDDTSYQTVQSELAMATGKWVGVGVGNGRAKQVIPATTTDFVLATIAEEFGLLGALAVIGLLGALVARIFWLAARAQNEYGRLALCGVGCWIGLQTCVNVMMANGTLPAIGIPLPFVSSGGSSLLALWCAIGICQSVAFRPFDSQAKLKKKPQLKAVVASGRTPSRDRVPVRAR